MPAPWTFSLDLEDHRPDADAEDRLPAAAEAVRRFLSEEGIRGTVFVVGEVARSHPGVVAGFASDGHEIGLHGHRHVPLTDLDPASFRTETAEGRAVVADLTGVEPAGYRAPTFSLVRETMWATDILADLGFRYSSSVLPASNPLYGFPGTPRAPFVWPSGLIEIPIPIIRAGVALPFGGTYLRVLPWPLLAAARRMIDVGPAPNTYCHPYDFDPEEPHWQPPETGRLTSRLLWVGRRRMFAKVRRVLGSTPGPPLVERLETADPDLRVTEAAA
jgi:polysaccharide deacetylase family protein (PEP-CTERM system associated)